MRESVKMAGYGAGKEREMRSYEDDEEQQGPVVVERAVHDAGMELQGHVKAGDMPAFETARLKAAQCREAGEADKAAFWNDVFNFLMWRESVGVNTKIVVLEEGESWNAATGKVIKSGSDRRRSDTGSR